MVICKPTCYLHVGLHKTGTSSIQGFLSEHHSELETYDFFYPTFYLTQNKKLKSKLITAHHRLFRSFIDKEKLLTLAEAKATIIFGSMFEDTAALYKLFLILFLTTTSFL